MSCNVNENHKRNFSFCLLLLLQSIHNYLSKMDFLSYFSVLFLQKQLKNLRDMLKKCLDKRNRLSRSGAPARELPKCQLFDQMAFLCEMSANKPTESNLPLMIDPLGSPFSEDSVITPPSPSSIGEVITETPIRPSQPSRKRKKESQASALTQSIEECDIMLKKTIEGENDEDSLYCHSLIPIMRELPKGHSFSSVTTSKFSTPSIFLKFCTKFSGAKIRLL